MFDTTPKNKMNNTDEIGENHISTNAETPMRKDAFELSDAEKIDRIEKNVKDMMDTLGLDLTDDSLQGTPKRVAKMFVQEIFDGLHPEKHPKMSTFENQYKYAQCPCS